MPRHTDPADTPFAAAVVAVAEGSQTLDQGAEGLLRRMTDEQLLWLLDGDTPTFRGMAKLASTFRSRPTEAGRLDALGIPGMRFTDGPRGVVFNGSTCFPVALARAASFDVDLERAIGEAIGQEASAQGASLFGGICVNLTAIPGWGRSQESYGEDPLVLGHMGAALAQGVNPWVMSTVKHFALNSMEEARFTVDVHVEEAVLREVYLPHFRTVVEAGVDSVMTSYNSVNGEWAGQNHHLITDVLREDWGFQGFVHTDWIWGLHDPVASLKAGQDLEMPFRQQRAAALPAALRDGRLDRADLERSAGRLLRAQIRLALRARVRPSRSVVACADHRRLAHQAAVRGTVLLRNELLQDAPTLPLNDEARQSVAVVGRLADQANLGDAGSSSVAPPSTCSIVQGLQERLGDRIVLPDVAGAPAAAALAGRAHTAVVVVGLGEDDEGESVVGLTVESSRLLGGPLRFTPAAWLFSKALALLTKVTKIDKGGDRRDLHLPAEDVALIRAVAAVNPRTVVVVVAGGTVMLDPWDEQVSAVLLAWYPGMEGGRAIADVLLGEQEPGGRLPLAIPRRREDLPTVDWGARRVTYGRWWGQRKLDHDGVQAAYPFGFGLGYTTFEMQHLSVQDRKAETFQATVSLTNTGTRTGRHVVQIYATAQGAGAERSLVGFSTVEAQAGQAVSVSITCSLRPLQRWNGHELIIPEGAIEVEAAGWSGDPRALRRSLG